MMTTPATNITVASTDVGGHIYFLRRAAVLLVVLALIAAVAAAATGRFDGLLGRDDALGREGSLLEVGNEAAAAAIEPEAPPAEPPPASPEENADEPVDEAPAPAPPVEEEIADDPDGEPAAIVPIAPSGASRLIAQAPERVLDTRRVNGVDAPPPSPETAHPITVAEGRTAVAVSVSLVSAERSGSVTVDGRSGVVEAVAVGGPASTVTNLVIVPVVGSELTVRNSAGGHLVVDLVGSFEPASEGTNSGRFVPVDSARITELETAVDGREAMLSFEQVTPAGGASAVLAVIVADVGADGGVVRLGPGAHAYDQMLMWGPADEANRQRRGLVLIAPDDAETSALRYDGGSALTVDVIGYFTDDAAPVALDGLYVASGPSTLFSGQLGPDEPGVLTGVEPGAGTAFATVARRSANGGQLWSSIVPVDDGSIQISASTEVQADVTLLGVFVR
jgi:hypothetical protein